jgi:hypothetical protein
MSSVSFDPRVDRLFGKVFNSPLHISAMVVIYSFPNQRKRYKTAIDEDMVALFAARTQLEDIPEPIKTYCDCCMKSYDVAKEIGIDWDISLPDKWDTFMSLSKAMPDEMKSLISAGLPEYVDKQKIIYRNENN